jgi:hypothetical protein
VSISFLSVFFLLSFVTEDVKDKATFAGLDWRGQYKKVETLSKECYMRELSRMPVGLLRVCLSRSNKVVSTDDRQLLSDNSSEFHQSLQIGFI